MRLTFAKPCCCLVAIGLFLACSEAPPRKPAAESAAAIAPVPSDTLSSILDTTAEPLDTTLGRCSVALGTPSQEQQQVIEALRAAYELEGSLITHGSVDTISREEVYAHYRTGFGEQLAQELTSYSWQDADHRLRSTDRALAVPETVGVLELKQDRALVDWIPPTSFRRQWGAPRCLIDRLIRENGRWIIQSHEP